jgi:hypothetical protein
MSRLIAALDRYWFAPASPYDLAIVRIVAFGSQSLFFILLPGGRLRSLGEQLDRLSVPVGLYTPLLALKVLFLPWGRWGEFRPSASFLIATFVVAILAGILATLGLYARVAMPVAAAAHALLVAHYYSYGEFHHAEALMMIGLFVLAMAPSAAVWSVDSVRARRRRHTIPSGLDEPSPDILALVRWPLLLMQWLIALSYLSAAGAKLYHGGLSWINGYTMTYQFLVVGLLDDSKPALFFASVPPQVHILPSILTLLFELSFVVAVLAPRTAWFYVIAGACFHTAIYVTMGIAFFQTMLLYCVFVDSLRRHWPGALSWRAVDRVRRSGAPTPR